MSVVPGGPWPWRESYVGAQWASEHSFQLLHAPDLSGYAATAPAPPSKGRLIRCTVPGSIPNCLAMLDIAPILATRAASVFQQHVMTLGFDVDGPTRSPSLVQAQENQRGDRR